MQSCRQITCARSNPTIPLVVDAFFFTERVKFVDRTGPAGIPVTQEREHEFTKRRGGDIDPKLIVVVSPNFLAGLAPSLSRASVEAWL
jgi:hypothetical protein